MELNEQIITDWYNNKYKELGNTYMRPLRAYQRFLDFLQVKKDTMLLDVACGTGFLLYLADKMGISTFGVDISDEAVKIARQESPNSTIIKAVGEDLPYDDGLFDYVYCLGSLEHFLDMNKGLQEMKRVAKHTAFFCVMVPNRYYFFWQFSRKKGTDQQDINETLLSLNEWKKIFRENSLEILHIYRDTWHEEQKVVLKNGNILNFIKQLLKKIIWLLLPLSLTYQFVFLLKKK